jgi:ATP-dependent Clp protease ATP-binding subunit ClpC
MLDEVKRLFKPEFINRIDDLVVFRQLSREDTVRILDLEIAKVSERLTAKGIELVLTPDAKEFLLTKGFDQAMGARPLRRAVQRYMEDPLAEEILRGDLQGAEKIEVVKADAGLAFRVVAGPAVKA